jgi:GNAT superfamily N-acetyltransferase
MEGWFLIISGMRTDWESMTEWASQGTGERKTSPENLRLIINPYDDIGHARAIVDLLDSYSRDPMGAGEPLSPGTRRDLVPELRRRPWIVTLLAILEEVPVGLLIAIEGFSTFAARPLLNLHDVAVHPDHRGRGIGTALFAEAEKVGRKRGCCKMTLEVLEGNEPARRLYRQLGFQPYVLDDANGVAQYWEKPLS